MSIRITVPSFLFCLLFTTSISSFAQKTVPSTQDVREQDDDDYEQQEHLTEHNEYAHAHSSWYREMLKKKPNIDKAQAAFNQYFSVHPENSRLKDRFETWISQASLYKDKHGFAIPYPLSKRSKYANTAAPGVTTANGIFGTWTMIGPANMTHVQPCNNSNLVTGGFCDRVFVNPYNTQNLFAGFSYGGLWVSTDQGASWQMTDGSFANGTNTYANRDYYYGEIKAHALNSSLVFAATEAGLLKSTNSGVNWTLCPTLNRNTTPGSRPYYIALATDDQNIVLSTFGKQVYRSADGGTTWTMVFDNTSGGASHTFTNQYTKGTPFGLNDRNYNFFGLEADFNDPNHFYLGVWNSSNQACIYESTDKGQNFQLLVNLNTGLSTNWGASTTLCLKTIPSSAAKFFLYEQFNSNKPYYKFSNAGTLLSADTIRTYPEAFGIDWNNENTLYQGQYGVYNATSGFQRSTDGGATFASPFSGSCNYLHSDIRGVSAVGNVVLIGNDGGLGLSTDGATTVNGTGYEINSMDIWGFSSSPKSDICLTGLDHNQTFVRRSSAAGGWTNIKGADAGVCTVNPYDDHWLYFDWAYGVNRGYLNADGTVTQYAVSSLPDLGSLQFHSNLLYNIFGIQKSNNNIVLQSGDNMATATTFKDFGQKVNAFRIARRDPTTMYALLSNKYIQKSIDSGATWLDITPSSVASSGQTNITAIEVGKTPGELWAAYGNAQNACKVLYSTDGGATWTNITTNNLPAAAVSDIAYQRGTNGGVNIMTITSAATIVWYKNNTMSQWQQVGSNLPIMGYLKSRLFVVPFMNKIRFGSSRGAWENDLYEQSGVEAGLAADRQAPVCAGDSVSYYNTSAYAPGTATFQWQFPGGSPATSTLENPKVSYAVPGTYAATLTVTTAAGADAITVNNLINVGPSQCGIDSFAGNAIAFATSGTVAAPVTLTGYNALSSTNSFTISAWIRPAATQNAWTGLICANNETSGSCILNFRNTNFELGVHWKGNLWSTPTGLFANPNEWNHVAMVVYPDSIRIYMNGMPFTYIQPTAVANWKDILLAGFNTRSDRNYNGLMDEIRIYNRSLSQDEVRALRHLTVHDPNLENGLVGYLQLNDMKNYILDKGRGAPVANRTYNTTNYNVSTAPVGSGVSEKATITASGTFNFVAPQVSVTFPSGATVPNGDVWISRLDTLPFGIDGSASYPQGRYYIVNNYGTNSTITAPNPLTFQNVTLPAPNYPDNRTFYLIKRGDNKDSLSHWTASLDSVQLSSNGTTVHDVPFTQLQITSFSQFLIKAGAPVLPLPLHIYYFNAQLVNSNEADLTWKLGESAGFAVVLEHSTDGVHFDSIYAARNVAGTYMMGFRHPNLVAGAHYYRIKVTEISGLVSYSTVDTVKVGQTGDIQVVPNPVINGVLYIKNGIGAKGALRLFDMGGRIVYQGVLTGEEVQPVQVKGLASGVYLVSIRTDTNKVNVLVEIK